MTDLVLFSFFFCYFLCVFCETKRINSQIHCLQRRDDHCCLVFHFFCSSNWIAVEDNSNIRHLLHNYSHDKNINVILYSVRILF